VDVIVLIMNELVIMFSTGLSKLVNMILIVPGFPRWYFTASVIVISFLVLFIVQLS
jgi:hypothetical protein